MHQEAHAIAPHPSYDRRRLLFDPASYPMRAMTVTVVLALVAIALIVLGTVGALATGGMLLGLAVHTAREAVHRLTRDRRAQHRG